MAKSVGKPNKSVRKQAASAVSTAVSSLQLPDFFKDLRLQSLLVFGFAFSLYANTLTHGFVLDDAIVITDNMYTQKGIEGIPGILSKDTFYGFFKEGGKENLVSGGRYRPFTLVVFAILYQFVGASTFAFHLLTVLLFALTCVLLFRTLQLLFAQKLGQEHATLLSLLTTALFAAHPIHTEVVNNIKGCDEIITLLLSMGTLYLVLKAYDTGKAALAWLSALVFFLACLSKENAVTFVVIIPLALWFFRTKTNERVPQSIFSAVLPSFIGFLVFFILRGSILHWKFGAAPMEFMNNPFLKIVGDHWAPFSFAEKLATVMYTLGKYVLLLIFPHPLTHDYYPRQIPMKTFADPAVLASVLLYAGMAWYAIAGIQKKDPVRFGILFYLLTLSIVSNLVFPVGTSMGERFAFIPSLGFCLVAAVLLLRLMQSGAAWQTAKLSTVLVVSGIVLALFSIKTLTRNPAWASNEKLFFTDAKTSTNSAKIQNAMGGILFDKAKTLSAGPERDKMFRESMQYADKALSIYPNYKEAMLIRAGSQIFLNEYEGSLRDYRRAIQIAPEDKKIPGYLALALREAGQFYGEKKGDLATAMKYLNESWQLNALDPATARLLGVACGFQGGGAMQRGQVAEAASLNQQALEWFKKAVALAPNDASLQYDLGTAYYIVGDKTNGEACHNKAFELDPELRKQKGQ
ncbi:MAG: glycosyltransferase family 39 protein [Lewinellaceae bacterium]|nr:glycosyltransferase family 39 protein [Lewinellaceae bacterium]